MEIKLNEINNLVYLTRTASYLCWNLNNKKKKTAILIIARIIIFLKYLVGLVGSINKSWEYLWPWNYRVYVALGTPMFPWTWNTGCSAVVGSCLLSRISSFLINTISRDDQLEAGNESHSRVGLSSFMNGQLKVTRIMIIVWKSGN